MYFLPSLVQAQFLQVVSATKQPWSGGMAEHYGIDYCITLTPVTEGIVFDSVYINNQGTRLGHGNTENVKTDSIHNRYTIYAGASNIFRKPTFVYTEDPPPLPAKRFDGEALVLYTYKGKHYTVIVKEMQTLSPMAYP